MSERNPAITQILEDAILGRREATREGMTALNDGELERMLLMADLLLEEADDEMTQREFAVVEEATPEERG